VGVGESRARLVRDFKQGQEWKRCPRIDVDASHFSRIKPLRTILATQMQLRCHDNGSVVNVRVKTRDEKGAVIALGSDIEAFARFGISRDRVETCAREGRSYVSVGDDQSRPTQEPEHQSLDHAKYNADEAGYAADDR